MKKPDSRKSRGRGGFPEEDDFSTIGKKAVKGEKPQKRIRLQDIDFEED